MGVNCESEKMEAKLGRQNAEYLGFGSPIPASNCRPLTLHFLI